MSDRGDAVRRLVASLEKDEQETKIIRADLEALQAAVRGLTGREGTVSEMVTDLAGVGRDMAALKVAVEAATGQKRDKVADLVLDLGAVVGSWEAIAKQKIAAAQDREALEARIQVAQVALDAVRLATAGHLGAPFYDALDRLDRALRGVPAADRVSADIPATVLRLELERANGREAAAQARTAAGRAAAAALRSLLNPAQGNMVPDAEEVAAALDALDRALAEEAAPRDRGRQGERFHAPATIEARLAEVERLIGSMSDHLAALDQRVAGLGNGLDEGRPLVGVPGYGEAMVGTMAANMVDREQRRRACLHDGDPAAKARAEGDARPSGDR